MDDRRFDQLARALGGASTRRGALAALLGLGVAAYAARDAGARRKCRQDSPAGQCCKRRDGVVTCTCDNGGAVCGANCCLIGQRCEGGQCVTEPAPCIAAGERCKDTGRVCCDGTVCASGQGGKGDVACYAPAGGACERSAECVFGSTCDQGTCVANQQPPEPLDCAVCASGCPFTTIEAAVAAATFGNEIITIAAGVYGPAVSGGSRAANWSGYLELPLPVTLQACGNGAVVIDCPPSSSISSCIHATHDSGTVTLDGLTLRGGATAAGVQPSMGVVLYRNLGSGNLMIRNCSISGFENGLLFQSDGALTVDGGAFTGLNLTKPKTPAIGMNNVSSNAAVCPNPPKIKDFDPSCEGTFQGCDCPP